MWFLSYSILTPDPELTINLNGSQYTSQSYDHVNGQYVFNVEQGTRFYLRYDTNTYPPPSTSDIELYRDGRHLQRSHGGTITLQGSYMDIQAVDQRYAGAYTIRSTSGAQVSFRLNVRGNWKMYSAYSSQQ